MKRIVLGLLAATAMVLPAFAADVQPAILYDLGGKLIALLPENADATILDRLRGKDTTGEGENEGTGGTTTQPPAEETPATNGAATNG